MIKGLVTGTKVRVLGVSEEKYIVTTNYYDSKYRLVQSIKNLYSSGTSVISSRYDFIGNVMHTKEWQSYGGSIDVDYAYNIRAWMKSINTICYKVEEWYRNFSGLCIYL